MSCIVAVPACCVGCKDSTLRVLMRRADSSHCKEIRAMKEECEKFSFGGPGRSCDNASCGEVWFRVYPAVDFPGYVRWWRFPGIHVVVGCPGGPHEADRDRGEGFAGAVAVHEREESRGLHYRADQSCLDQEAKR